MQDSDDDGFAKQGGEPIDIGADFDDSEEEPDDEDEDEPQSSKPQAMQHLSGQKPSGPSNADVKGQKVDNQPFDLAVDVNDSEEIESDEEEDRMNVDMEV